MIDAHETCDKDCSVCKQEICDQVSFVPGCRGDGEIDDGILSEIPGYPGDLPYML
jgi:hypothetical protein